MTTSRPANRLIHETSPYLLQHAHNPVDWYPWGQEALARARAENKPILLSIGLLVLSLVPLMERESFENEGRSRPHETATFVSVKGGSRGAARTFGRYLHGGHAVALNGGQGGWPMTVFLTPDQRPFFAGTYFPPTDRFGRPGFSTLLTQLATSGSAGATISWSKRRR